MISQKDYPFEKNKYYLGKLLTARDFEDEQNYFNNKRRLMNRLYTGSGVVCGLNVYTLDNESLVIESGVAIDEKGQEIVVDETIIKKLVTFDGFDEVDQEELYLGIEYAEEGREKIYAPMCQEEDANYTVFNKIRENYRLFLAQKGNMQEPTPFLDTYIAKEKIYKDEEITIWQYTPRFTNDTEALKIKIVLQKHRGEPKEYELRYTLQLQGFRNSEGKSQLEIMLSTFKLKEGEQIEKEYIITPQGIYDNKILFYIKPHEFALTVDGRRNKGIDKEITFKLEVKDEPVLWWEREVYYKQSLDKHDAVLNGQKIWLAKIKVIRKLGRCTIEEIQTMPYKQYSYSARQLALSQQLKEYYPYLDASISMQSAMDEKFEETITNKVKKRLEARNDMIYGLDSGDMKECFRTGIIDIYVGDNRNTKEVIFTEEIMHKLGRGAVYIDIGVEYIKNDDNLSSSEIIIGDASLFKQDGEKPFNFKYAIKIYKEKGTFVVALRLEEAAKVSMIHMRWYAFKLPYQNEPIVQNKLQGQSMRLNPETVIVEPYEVVRFNANFFNMEEVPCHYEVYEAEGGSISSMGVYTAPSKPGVYTVEAYTLEEPRMTSKAFVIVQEIMI